MLKLTLSGFPHSEIFGSKFDWQLPEAYSSLPPSSPVLKPNSFQCTSQVKPGAFTSDLLGRLHALYAQ